MRFLEASTSGLRVMFAALRRFFSRCLPSTTAGKWSLTTFVLLTTTFSVVIVCIYSTGLSLRQNITPSWVTVVLLLLALPTVVLYVTIRKWGQYRERPLYEDIHRAWFAGLEALSNAGISLQDRPVFVLLGSSGEQLEQSLIAAMRSGGLNFQIADVPALAGVAHALRWYVSDNAIYVFCTQTGALSELARQWARAVPAGAGGRRLPDPGPASTQFPRPSFDPTQTLASLEAAEGHRGSASGMPRPVPAVATSAPGPVASRDTTIGAEDIERAVAEGLRNESGQAWRPHSQAAARLPARVEMAKETQRLKYLCQLLKRARAPLCGLNGVVTLLPFELVEAGGEDLELLREAIRTDLDTIRDAMWIRFPVSALVVGMERAPGFTKFVELLETPNWAKRMGSGFDPRRQATGDRLRQLCDGICDRFEDWIYSLYRQPDALQPERQSGNIGLYRLLCRVRTDVKPKLNTVLGQTFDVTKNSAGLDFFSGCYLAATGGLNEERAFIKELHDKLAREQNNVQWLNKAHRRRFWLNVLTWAGWSIVLALLVVLMGLVLTHWWL